MHENCDCACEPCPEGTKLCPTSNYCLDVTSWCNGYKECSDDEKDCPTTTEYLTTPESTTEPFISTTPEVASTQMSFYANTYRRK